MLDYSPIDRRLFERVIARFPAKIKDAGENFGSTLNLRDASAWGIKLSSKERYYLNDSVSVEVSLPDGMFPVILRGQIVWTKAKEDNSWDMGVKFHNIRLVEMSRLFSHAVGAGWQKPT